MPFVTYPTTQGMPWPAVGLLSLGLGLGLGRPGRPNLSKICVDDLMT